MSFGPSALGTVKPVDGVSLPPQVRKTKLGHHRWEKGKSVGYVIIERTTLFFPSSFLSFELFFPSSFILTSHHTDPDPNSTSPWSTVNQSLNVQGCTRSTFDSVEADMILLARLHRQVGSIVWVGTWPRTLV